MSDFINKVIQIKNKEEKKTKTGTNTTVSFQDQDGVKFVYWKLLKAGGLSQVAEQFRDMQLDEGSIVQVSYVIDEYLGSDGKQHTSNKVISFRETSEQPVVGQKVVQQPKPAPKANTYVPNEEKPNWDNIAVGKVQSLFLQAFIQSGKTFSEAKLQVTQARQLAELVVFGEQKSQVQNQEPLPTIQQEEPPLPDLPF